MNERLKELLTPKLKEWGGDSGDNFSEELEKFAELIIKECIKIVEPDAPISAMYIENHFGENDE